MLFFDPPQVFDERFGKTTHLESDLLGPEGHAELMGFSRRIGLRPGWLQKKGSPDEHFDLMGGAIARAKAAGAVEVTRQEAATKWAEKRRAWVAKYGRRLLTDKELGAAKTAPVEASGSRAIEAARLACEKLGARQVILLSFGQDGHHLVASYGKSKEACEEAKPLCDAIADQLASGALRPPGQGGS